MLKESLKDSENLLNSAMYFPKGMITQFAEKEPQTVKEMFINLFDESINLHQRISNFAQKSETILQKYWEPGKNHYQDLHTISTYLCFKYPEKYYIYKVSVDKKAAELINVNISNSDKITELINFFDVCNKVLEHIKQDKELLELSHNALDETCYPDKEYHALVFDLLFYAGAVLREPKVWIYSPGEQSVYWNECINENIMVLGWDELGDFNVYKSKKQIKEALDKAYPTEVESSKKNDVLAIWEFKEEMREGDIVYVKKGASKIIGMGIVKSDYYFENFRESFKHVRNVEWKVTNIEKNYIYHKLPIKTLTDITKYPDFCTNLEKLIKGEEQNLNMNENKKYFWLNANPKIWSFSELKNGEIIEYTAVNENGNKRRIYRNYQNAKKGDMVIAYEATPTKAIVGLCVIEEELKNDILKVKKLETLINPIPYSDILNEEELSNMEYIQNPQGSLFSLTENEFNIIMDLIREYNPTEIQKTNPKFTKQDFLNKVYIAEEEYDKLVNLLFRKKNIILQGAPGVGKTYIAKKLAYSIMGEENNDRIKFIQFHQSYSYEDFIEGFRPTETNYELQQGIFYNFCKQAENDPNQPYFFIIDEINRGNLSKIFGELLMLIECDKRGEKLTLAYSKKGFNVPENLYIIGMMNTADRSLALIDYALRRRFAFYKMRPAFENEKFIQYKNKLNNGKFNKLIDMIKNINTEICKDYSLGEGFEIGHSYFCELQEVTDEDIESIITYEILPLLEEYWFDDLDKYNEWKEKLNGVING